MNETFHNLYHQKDVSQKVVTISFSAKHNGLCCGADIILVCITVEIPGLLWKYYNTNLDNVHGKIMEIHRQHYGF